MVHKSKFHHGLHITFLFMILVLCNYVVSFCDEDPCRAPALTFYKQVIIQAAKDKYQTNIKDIKVGLVKQGKTYDLTLRNIIRGQGTRIRNCFENQDLNLTGIETTKTKVDQRKVYLYNGVVSRLCSLLNSKKISNDTNVEKQDVLEILDNKNSTQDYYIVAIQKQEYDFSFLTCYFAPYLLSSFLSGIGGVKKISHIARDVDFCVDTFYYNKTSFLPLRLCISRDFEIFNINVIGINFLSLAFFFILKVFGYFYEKFRCLCDPLYADTIYADNFFLENLTLCMLLNSLTLFEIDVELSEYFHVSFNLFTGFLCAMYRFAQPFLNQKREVFASNEAEYNANSKSNVSKSGNKSKKKVKKGRSKNLRSKNIPKNFFKKAYKKE